MSFAASSSMKLTSAKSASLCAPLNLRVRSKAPRVSTTICASQKNDVLLTPTVAASIAASLSLPDVASATTLTPSVQALINSVVAGGIVAALILGAVTLVAGFDPIARK